MSCRLKQLPSSSTPAQISIDDPRANQMAQKDVEAAFLKWGRFEPVSDPKTADLIVMVRKGTSRPMDDTMPDPGRTAESIPATVPDPWGLHMALNPIVGSSLALDRASNLPDEHRGSGGLIFPSSKAAKIPSLPPRCGRMPAGRALALRVLAVAAFKQAVAAAEKAEGEKH